MKMRSLFAALLVSLVVTIAATAAGQTSPLQTPESPGPNLPPPSFPSDTATPPSPQAPSAPPVTAAPAISQDMATAPKELEFGDRGEYVISGSFSLSFGHLGYSNSDASTTSFSFQPSFDYFIAKNWLIGGAAFMSHADTIAGLGVETNSITYGAYLHLGGNIPIGSELSWRLLGSIGVWRQRAELSPPSQTPGFVGSFAGQAVPIESNGTTVTETVVVAEIFAPFLIHPARHFFLGFGPDVYVDISHTIADTQNNRTFIGASSIVGGWFGGERRDYSPPASMAVAPESTGASASSTLTPLPPSAE